MTVQELIHDLSDPSVPQNYKVLIHYHNDVINKYKELEGSFDINPDGTVTLDVGMIYD